MKQFKFIDRFSGEEKGTLTINGDGTFSVDPESREPRFRAMLNHMGKDPKPTSIFEFIKSGLYTTEVFRYENDQLYTLENDD